EACTAAVIGRAFLHCAPTRPDLTYSFRKLREDDQWPGAPRPSLRSASASRSTGTCRLSSDPAELARTRTGGPLGVTGGVRVCSRIQAAVADIPRSSHPIFWALSERSIHDDAPDALALVHQLESLVDVGQRHGMRDHRVDFDLALHVPVDDFRHVGAPARAAKGRALPDAPGDQLEWAGCDL